MIMEEIRIDVTKQTAEELALANEHAQLIFKFNHTMPGTPEYAELMHRIFPTMGEGSRIRPRPETPVNSANTCHPCNSANTDNSGCAESSACSAYNEEDIPIQLGLDSCGD